MKRLLFILGIVLMAAVLFAAGVMVGGAMNFMKNMLTVRMMQDDLDGMIETYTILSQLDRGEVDGAKQSLNVQLDGHIISLSQMLPNAPDAESKRIAEKMLQRIAQHRDQFPSTGAPTNLSVHYGEVERAVSNALEKAKMMEAESGPRD
jgi:hypothetical protein